MKEAFLYEKLKDKKVRCNVCSHHCIINDGEYGICGVRKNENGKLVSLVYGKAIALHVDPIEKKPLFHFLPKSLVLSLGTVGCNFGCLFCQNWEISQAPREKFFWHNANIGKDWLPSKIVSEALKQECQTIAYTYTEPTVFLEYAYETMQIAREAGLKNVWISNGYMSSQAVELILPYLDAVNIDLKSFSEKFYNKLCGARLTPILENIKTIKKSKTWLELTTLIIPDHNDSPGELKKIANFIAQEIGKDTPWHISKFYPAYKMADAKATDIKTIERAIKIGKKAGLKYVYAGNVPSSPYESTYCPRCGELLIERVGYVVRRYDDKGRCPRCKTKIDGILN